MRCRRVIFFARYFAGHQRATNIEPVHLLRGLVEEDGDRFKRLLKSLRVDPSSRSVDPEDIRRNAPIPLAADSKRIITLAAGEAERLGSLNIATGHFWLACLAEENQEVLTVLHRLLRESGTSVDKLRQSIEENLEEM